MELTLQNDDLFQMIKARMTTEEVQIFMDYHYLYLQHGADSTKFVIDFDNVWKDVGFTRRCNAKRILMKHFTENENYTISVPKGELPPGKGKVSGQSKETILLTVDCFKCFCVVASTPKAKVIRSYHTKMENIMCEYYKTTHDALQAKHEALQHAQKEYDELAQKEYDELIEFTKSESDRQEEIEKIKLRIKEKRIKLVATLCKNNDEAVELMDKITSH